MGEAFTSDRRAFRAITRTLRSRLSLHDDLPMKNSSVINFNETENEQS